MSEVQVSNWINGQATGPAGGERLDNLAPATGKLLSRIPRSGPADVEAAVKAAQRCHRDVWSQTTAGERADFLDRVADRIEAGLDELAALESRDTGKPIRLAKAVDIPRAAANFRFFAGAIRHDATECHDMGSGQGGALNYTLRKSCGVAGLITPWNLPLYLLSWKVAPAIAMGNTVVAKPSEMTPMTADALGAIFAELDAPAGLLNIVHGLGAEVGQALVEHPKVPLISFTGGTATGKRVAATAAPMFKKLSLELGGKNPTVVFADADFDAAVEGAARAGFLNQGQVCLCGSRILVERSIHEPFVEALTARVEAMVVGDPSDPETELGALISAAHREKVEGYIALAREEGGTIQTGGGRPELGGDSAGGFFVQPTVVTGLEHGCRTSTEEIFGPVVTVHAFDGEDDALRLANGVRYGLCASVWTQNLGRAHRFSAALDTGMVWVNTWLLRDLRVPFGGMKDSGVGREGGRHSLEFFSESRNICIKL